MTHQELLTAYAKARTAVISEYYGDTDIPMARLRWRVALYAQENSLEYPEEHFSLYDFQLENMKEWYGK